MKFSLSIIALLFFLTSCDNAVKRQFQAEVDERFPMLREEISTLPRGTPVSFYRVQGSGNSPQFVTSCLSNEVKFDKPYLVANNKQFHVYYWQSTQNRFDNSTRAISVSELRFNPEP